VPYAGGASVKTWAVTAVGRIAEAAQRRGASNTRLAFDAAAGKLTA